jgi:hypothetical protein
MQRIPKTTLGLTLAFSLVAGMIMTTFVLSSSSLLQPAFAKSFREAPQGGQAEQLLGPNTIRVPPGAGDRDVLNGYITPINSMR